MIQIVSISTRSAAGVVSVVDPASYSRDGDEVVVSEGSRWVCEPGHVIRYRAGYDGRDVADGGTGKVPERVVQAIAIAVQDLLRVSEGGSGLRSETVEGVGAKTFMDGDRASALARQTFERLLAGLRVYSL